MRTNAFFQMKGSAIPRGIARSINQAREQTKSNYRYLEVPPANGPDDLTEPVSIPPVAPAGSNYPAGPSKRLALLTRHTHGWFQSMAALRGL
jgi:hypothetical protein